MCGIFGVISERPADIEVSRAAKAASCLEHRGPDASGQWAEPGRVVFGHKRLAIIDLSPESNQPFISECGRFVLVYNGEIYNYVELSTELKEQGCRFRTTSDTEVLLQAYVNWGPRCVKRFNGDWAFAIYDREKHSLFCSRDRFGVKPFNYAIVGKALVFASEIKAIIEYFPGLRKPNYNVISNYCRNGLGAQHESSWFAGVERLEPGHNLYWTRSKTYTERYWEYPNKILSNIRFEDAVQEYQRLFNSAVRLRMRSDVPVGTTLSGGLDSTSIVGSLRQWYVGDHSTFTASFANRQFARKETMAYRAGIDLDETNIVNETISKLQLSGHFVAGLGDNFIGELANVLWHLESGHSSPATLPLARVFNVARRNVTVVLEGQGADELLAGYITNMFPYHIAELLGEGRGLEAIREVAEYSKSYSLPYSAKVFFRLLESRWIERTYHRASGHNHVFSGHLKHYNRLSQHPGYDSQIGDLFNRMLCRAHSGGLVNLLHYGDALSMANSVESRLPFMDVDLVEFGFKLPHDFKIHNARGKYIHREAMRGIVRESVLNSRVKLGFATPLAGYFDDERSPAFEMLLSERCASRGLFNRDGIRDLIQKQTKGKRDFSTFLFRLLSTEIWHRIFIDDDWDLEMARSPFKKKR